MDPLSTFRLQPETFHYPHLIPLPIECFTHHIPLKQVSRAEFKFYMFKLLEISVDVILNLCFIRGHGCEQFFIFLPAICKHFVENNFYNFNQPLEINCGWSL